MAHFEIWYAIKNGDKYLSFTKKKDEISQHAYDGFEITELAVSVTSELLRYMGVFEGGNLVSILDYQLAEHLYDDLTNLLPLSVTPITRCGKCQVMLINGVFHWSYKNRPTTPEQVLAKVCIPTAGHGDRQHIPCLAKQLHEADLGLLQKTPAELHDFVRANNNTIEFELPDEDYYLKMAKEILDEL
jgi:hypothetical protein